MPLFSSPPRGRVASTVLSRVEARRKDDPRTPHRSLVAFLPPLSLVDRSIFVDPPPIPPTVCSQKSIVHSIKTAAVQADFQILVSIYNPNVMDATIESGTAILYHKHTEV